MCLRGTESDSLAPWGWTIRIISDSDYSRVSGPISLMLLWRGSRVLYRQHESCWKVPTSPARGNLCLILDSCNHCHPIERTQGSMCCVPDRGQRAPTAQAPMYTGGSVPTGRGWTREASPVGACGLGASVQPWLAAAGRACCQRWRSQAHWSPSASLPAGLLNHALLFRSGWTAAVRWWTCRER
jgi:hypothetical protein